VACLVIAISKSFLPKYFPARIIFLTEGSLNENNDSIEEDGVVTAKGIFSTHDIHSGVWARLHKKHEEGKRISIQVL
jgi:hypothetical protein